MGTPARVDHRPFVQLLHRDLDLGAYFDAVDLAVSRQLSYDSACWLSLDPGTWLPTSHFSREFGRDHLMQLAANEYLEEDVNKFGALARERPAVGILSRATGGDLSRSARHTRILTAHGYGKGDELRAVFLDGDDAWGCVALHRRTGTFGDREVELIDEMSGMIVDGIRRAIVRAAAVHDADPDPPGLILFGPDDLVERQTPAATRWVQEIFDGDRETVGLPVVVAGVAHTARRAGTGQTGDVASVRVPTRTGGWLRLDASLLDDDPGGRIAVIVHPARRPDVATLIVERYGLSGREREVTRLVLHGHSTREIAQRLKVSPYTVQDHLKAIFGKVGVHSRGELVAHLFLQEAAPRLASDAPIGADGWFVTES